MLNIYTNTFCRPDYVQLLADALAATTQEEYRFSVIVQPGGLRREWRNVAEVLDGERTGYRAWRDAEKFIGEGSRTVLIHDDCVPVLPWDSSVFPGPFCSRRGGATLQYYDGHLRPPVQAFAATRHSDSSLCEKAWSSELCKAATDAYAESMLEGRFIHIDKGTIGSPSCPANASKPALVAAICDELNIEAPSPLTPDELASHPGRNIASVYSQPGLGDIVKAGLSAVGITEERVSKVVGKPCGCGKRAEAMNKFGAKYLGMPPGRMGNLQADA